METEQKDFGELKSEIESLKAKVEALKKDNEKEIVSLKQDNEAKLTSLKKANETEIASLKRTRNIVLFLMLIAIIGLGIAYFMLNRSYENIHRENIRLRNEQALRKEQREREGKAKEILLSLRSDSVAGRFYDSLVYVDYVNNFRDADHFSGNDKGVVLAGSLTLPPLFFCREYESSQSELGFFNSDGLKSALKSLYRGDFSVRSNMRFIFESDPSRSWNDKKNMLEDAAFFSAKTLRPGAGSSITGLESKIADCLKETNDEPVLRFFFSTNHDGLYVTAIMKGNKVSGCYLSSGKNAVNRSAFFNDIREKLRQSEFDGEENTIQISLWNPDTRLDGEIDFNTCIDIFIKQLSERSH